MNILITIIILGIIIFIHELGHFSLAKLFKIPVDEFAIGMGPTLVTYDGEKTKYSVRMIPMGGFVSIRGMEVDSKEKDGFNKKPVYQRFLVIIAGVVMNFLLAFVIVVGVVFSGGKMEMNDKAIVGEVIKRSNAVEALKKGDRILEINGKKVTRWKDLKEVTKGVKKEIINLKVERKNKIVSENIKLTYDEGEKRYFIGILPSYILTKLEFKDGLIRSIVVYKNLFTMIRDGFYKLVTGKVSSKEVAGPVGMVKIVAEVKSDGGLASLFLLTALLSINIGFLNLLPFPALDGGRLIFLILEGIGLEVNKKLEEKVHMVGMILLLGAIVFITYGDIAKLITR